MSYFLQAADAHFQVYDDITKHHRDYALATNERGEELIGKLVREFTGDLAGKRVLDIGSGYGGVCIAAGKRGAQAVGLEYGAKQVELAGENLRDHPGLDVRFLQGDATSPEGMAALGTFDLITCDNVIEHVESANALVSNISLALNRTGIAYVTCPNAYSVGQIRRDCHYLMFGLSILDREDAEAFYRQMSHRRVYDVTDYYKYEEYVSRSINTAWTPCS